MNTPQPITKIIIRFFISITLFTFPPVSILAQVQFSDSSFQSVITQAQHEEKKVMVHAYTDWCGSCHKMDSIVFADTTVGKLINKKFLSLRINAEEGFGIDFAMKYRINIFPQILFFDNQGHLRYRWIGYAGVDNFNSILSYVDSAKAEFAPLPNPLNFELDYPTFYRNTYKKRRDRSFPTDAQLKAFMTTRQTITDEVTWGVLSKLVTEQSYSDTILKYRPILNSRYGEFEVNDKLGKLTYAQVKTAIKDRNEALLMDALEKTETYFGDRSGTYKLRYRLYFYQMTGDWQSYVDIGTELAADTLNHDDDRLSEMAQAIYRNTNRKQILKPALDWMQDITEAVPTYENLCTLAFLNYKLNHIDLAEKQAEQALAAAKRDSITDTTEIEALQKMLNLTR